MKYFILIIDEYEREETRQVYGDLNNNIEVSGDENLNILNRGISMQSRMIATEMENCSC